MANNEFDGMELLDLVSKFMEEPESVGNNIVPIIYDLIDSLPEADMGYVLKEVADKIYTSSYDADMVRIFFDGYEQHKDIKALNLQLLSVVGIMKHYISKIDENNNQTMKAEENMKIYAAMIKALGIPLRNYDKMLDDFKARWGREQEEKEMKNGDLKEKIGKNRLKKERKKVISNTICFSYTFWCFLNLYGIQ